MQRYIKTEGRLRDFSNLLKQEKNGSLKTEAIFGITRQTPTEEK